MKTYKRRIVEIDTSVNNISRYSNQLSFTGIKQDNNIFNVDQSSQVDTLNVYVDDEQKLISREPLAEEHLPIELHEDDQLIDIKSTNGVTIYVVKNMDLYMITAYRSASDQTTISCLNNYHLVVYNQYAICFREEGAKILDSTKSTLNWIDIQERVEVPVSKQTTGSETIDLDDNQLSNLYIHKYIRTADLNTLLPEADLSVQSIEAKIYTANGVGDYGWIKNAKPWKDSDYRFFKALPITLLYKDELLVANNTVIIARPNYFLLSYDNGYTFTQITYPKVFIRPSSGVAEFDNDLKAISEDGENFFYCTASGVYRCSLADLTWTHFTFHNIDIDTLADEGRDGLGLKINEYKNVYFSNACHFKNAEVFCFKVNGRIYFKAPGMSTDSTEYNNTLCWVLEPFDPLDAETNGYPTNSKLLYQRSIKIDINELGNGYLATTEFDNPDTNGPYHNYRTTFSSVIGQGETDVCKIFRGEGPTLSDAQDYWTKGITVESIKYLNDYNDSTPIAVEIKGVVNRIRYETDSQNKSGYGIYEYTYVMGHDNNRDQDVVNNIDMITWNRQLANSFDGSGTPIKLTDTIYYVYDRSFGLLLDVLDLDELVGKYGESGAANELFSYNDYTYQLFEYVDSYSAETQITNSTIYKYYNTNSMSGKNTVFINKIAKGDRIEVDYYIRKDGLYNSAYKRIPSVSYSGTELYLAFDNELQITSNIKDGSDIYFNLPKTNNQSFSNTITNMINISTSEVAIFFVDGIMIHSKTALEDGQTAYSLNKTRLSLGVRLGDDVINTLDGANTIFATKRGLAIMNYQAYMATTDQVLSFASDQIVELWNEFFSDGNNIKLLQLKNYVFISNQTNIYLMLDLRTMSWWKFQIPFKVLKFLTDQVALNIISDKLYKLDKEFNRNKYFDCDGSMINWLLISQRLHFSTPNHYKNLKQLVFQLVQSNDFKNTINTRIKLYRKVVTYKEPEIIDFKIDEYRTFVKRFNYWKINELQWGIANDTETTTPAQLILNGIDIKYEIGEEVR